MLATFGAPSARRSRGLAVHNVVMAVEGPEGAARQALFDAVERHQVRIEAKKLRYALDFLGSLWPPEALHDLTEALVQAQELLGQMNDRVSAQHLLATAPQAGAERLQMVLGAQLVQSAAHLPLVLKAVMQASTPWK